MTRYPWKRADQLAIIARIKRKADIIRLDLKTQGRACTAHAGEIITLCEWLEADMALPETDTAIPAEENP